MFSPASEYVAPAVQNWQPLLAEEDDEVLVDAVMKPKPLVSVLSSLSRMGEDQHKRKMEQNDEIIDFDYSNSVHSVLNCFKKRMNVIEECELFDESDDDYEIDVDKLIDSEHNMSNKFKNRHDLKANSSDIISDGESDLKPTSTAQIHKPVSVSKRSGNVPIQKSAGAIFGSHKRIDEVTYRNYVNATKPSTLVVSKVQGNQPRIDTTGVPLRDNDRFKKFEDFVVDKKKKAEEDHKLKDFRDSPYSVLNIVKKYQKQEPRKTSDEPKPKKKLPISTVPSRHVAPKKKVVVKKVDVHHHHFYQDGHLVHSETVASASLSQPSTITNTFIPPSNQEVENPLKKPEPEKFSDTSSQKSVSSHKSKNSDRSTSQHSQKSKHSSNKSVEEETKSTCSSKHDELISNKSIQNSPYSPPTSLSEREKENYPPQQPPIITQRPDPIKINDKVAFDQAYHSDHSEEEAQDVAEDSYSRIKQTPNNFPQQSQNEVSRRKLEVLQDKEMGRPQRGKEAATSIGSQSILSELALDAKLKARKPSPIEFKKPIAEEEFRKKDLMSNIDEIMAKKKDAFVIEMKMKRLIKKKEKKRRKSPITASVKLRKSVSSPLKPKTYHYLNEILKDFNYFRVKPLPIEKKLALVDVQPQQVATLSTPSELEVLMKMAELSYSKINSQLAQIPDDEQIAKEKRITFNLLEEQLQSIRDLTSKTKEYYKIASERIPDSVYEYLPDKELDDFAEETKRQPMVVNKEGKGFSYPHPIDDFNKKKAAGVVGYYKSVLPTNERKQPRPSSAPSSRQTQSTVKNTSKTGTKLQQTPSRDPRKLRIQVDRKTRDYQTSIVEEELGSSPTSSTASDRRISSNTPGTASKYFNLTDSAEEGHIELHPMY